MKTITELRCKALSHCADNTVTPQFQVVLIGLAEAHAPPGLKVVSKEDHNHLHLAEIEGFWSVTTRYPKGTFCQLETVRATF